MRDAVKRPEDFVPELTDGVIRVSYQGVIADILPEHYREGLAELSGCNRAERKRILASVHKTIEQALKKIEAGQTLSETERRNLADDIGLWFVGEVIAGRAEGYKTPVH